MNNLSFHVIEQEKRGSQTFLILEVQHAQGKRKLYPDAFLSKPDATLSLLVEQELQFQGISPRNSQASTACLNTLHIEARYAFDVVTSLQKNGVLYFNKKRLSRVSSELKLEYEIEGQELRGKIWCEQEKKEISSSWFLFPSAPILAFFEDKLGCFSKSLQWKWINAIYPNPKQFDSDRAKQRWVEEIEMDEMAPRRVVMQEPKKTLLPFLILQDRTGGFASLWFDYQGKKVAMHDSALFVGRDLEQEKYWEKDLLEMGFVKKQIGQAHYFCSLDRAGDILSFLLEMGWNVFDLRGKKLLKLSESALELSLQEDRVVFEGRLMAGDEQLELKKLAQAAKAQSMFVDLSETGFSLVDKKGPLIKLLQEFTDTDWAGEKITLSKFKAGLLTNAVSLPGIQIEPSFSNLIEELQNPQPATPKAPFKATLYSYQQQGVSWLKAQLDQGFSPLLADQMGLGKTVQVLGLLSQILPSGPILVVCPSSLLFNWKKEIEKFLPGVSCYLYSGPERSLKGVSSDTIILSSYALLRQDLAELKQLSIKLLILDEAQTIKNSTSQSFQAACSINAEARLAMSGTPIENRIEDLVALFRFLMPGLLTEADRTPARIKKVVQSFILRRTKDILGDELPEKIEQTVWVDMTPAQRTFYEQFLSQARSGLLKKVSSLTAAEKRMEIFEILLRLRQICCHPVLFDENYTGDSGKMQRLFSDLEEVMQEGRKCIVFSQFTSVLKLIAKECEERGWPFAYLDGSTKDRQKAVESFQQDANVPLFLVSLKAGGVGLNLVEADYVFLFDPWWNLAAEEQAIDRAHRIGRKGTLMARRYVCANSVEERVMQLKERKQQIIQEALEETGLNHQELLNIIEDL